MDNTRYSSKICLTLKKKERSKCIILSKKNNKNAPKEF